MDMGLFSNMRVYCSLLVTAVAVLCLLVASSVYAETQVVEINKSYSECEVCKPSERELRNEALVQGAIQAINKILHTSMSDPGKELYKGYLKNKIDEYVLSYSTERQVISDTQSSLTMNVTLNTQDLKELLKTWGTYYTYQKEFGWRYSLNANMIKSKPRKEIEMLESMSGLTQKESGYPSLDIRRMEGDNNWFGVLKTEDKVWTEQDPELYLVWKRLWSRYFSSPRVLEKLEQELYICIGHWASVSGMQNFHRKLNSWEYLLDRTELLNANIKANGIKGCWRLVTINLEPLKDRLIDYIESRSLQYSFSDSEIYPNEDSF